MSENREEILANFQACTGIEDVVHAIFLLDNSDWDLLTAVNRVIPQDHYGSNTEDSDVQVIDVLRPEPATPTETATDMVSIGNNVGHSTMDLSSQPSTSTVKPKYEILKFTIHFNEKTFHIEMPDNGTFGELKFLLYSQVEIVPCRQLITGWTQPPANEATVLGTLNLPKENVLYLSAIEREDGVTADNDTSFSERLTSEYLLRIYDETNNQRYNLRYPGTRTVLGVKTDIYTLTDISVRHQIWTGWPLPVDDQTMIAMTGINYPSHDLMVKKSSSANSSKDKDKNSGVVDIADSDSSSVEEFEDASESFNVEDDMFTENIVPKKIEPLIPEYIDDEIIGCISFFEQFVARYGAIHPTFYTASLENTIKDTCSKPAKERKILALYLHHDSSVLSNVFCTQLLCSENIMQMLENNFILWGWDITFESNKMRLLTSVAKHLGALASMTIRNIPTDKLPAIILIMKIRSSTEIHSVIHGNVSASELLMRLVDAVDNWTTHQRVEIREEEERAARELVKWEQDQAYRESLEADRAKDEAKRLQEKLQTENKQRLESEKAEEDARKERYRLEVEARLPPEPTEGSGDSISKVRFRLPNGEFIIRRFSAQAPLKVLFDFLVVKGYPPTEFKIICSWPRRDLSSTDTSKTLQELNLFPQETVILEER